MQEVWTRLIEAQAELMDEVDRLITLKIEVVNILERLPRIEYDVLYKIYISHYSVQQVAEMKNYTRQGIYDIKDRALEKLQKILDSR
jgi:DNA-directed RNA polymerase specialized sigma24 family protein